LLDDSGQVSETPLPLEGEYEALLALSEPHHDFPELDENTRATTFYTTGTTGTAGLPKGVYFSHRQLVLHTLATRTALGGTGHGASTRAMSTCPSPRCSIFTAGAFLMSPRRSG